MKKNINLHADTSQIQKLYFEELKTLYKEQKEKEPYVLTVSSSIL